MPEKGREKRSDAGGKAAGRKENSLERKRRKKAGWTRATKKLKDLM